MLVSFDEPVRVMLNSLNYRFDVKKLGNKKCWHLVSRDALSPLALSFQEIKFFFYPNKKFPNKRTNGWFPVSDDITFRNRNIVSESLFFILWSMTATAAAAASKTTWFVSRHFLSSPSPWEKKLTVKWWSIFCRKLKWVFFHERIQVFWCVSA